MSVSSLKACICMEKGFSVYTPDTDLLLFNFVFISTFHMYIFEFEGILIINPMVALA
jgi:hypothetical protein